MATFKSLTARRATLIDRRAGIGPHHLAIGKTRKLFRAGGVVHALFSQGYTLAHARLGAETADLVEVRPLDVPVAFGGGAFCLDDDGEGRVVIVFVHRNRHELCALTGELQDDDIVWDGWRTLLRADSPLAAPWVEIGLDGVAWASVLARTGDFRVVRLDTEGRARSALLFAPDEAAWHHSCVQMMPVGRDECLAVGFRGQFPVATELVVKPVSDELALGEAKTLAPCNVNDQLTFHFQSVGDPSRARGHIAYLDKGLHVSHALYEAGSWTVVENVMPFAAYAPQLSLRSDGALVLLAVDYEGAVWSAAWRDGPGWTAPRSVEGLPRQTISPAFARTGYGTGGLISAARSPDSCVPFLMGVVTDDREGLAELHAASLGAGDALTLAQTDPLTVSAKPDGLTATVRLRGLREADLDAEGRCWLVTVPLEGGAALKLAATASRGELTARAYVLERAGGLKPLPGRVGVQAVWHDAFEPAPGGVATLGLDAELPGLAPVCARASVEIYARGWRPEGGSAGGALADLAPFTPETAALTARDPAIIPSMFKRLV